MITASRDVSTSIDATAVSVRRVSVRYRLAKEKPGTLQEYLIQRLKGKKMKYEDFQALKSFDLDIAKGETVGVIGHNGAGKSTLLKVIAGVLKPSTGSVTVKGKLAPLIELGAGFDQELTGAENIFLNASILGLSRSEIEAKFNAIIDFSELREFIYSPLKSYSSGMIARLGFSIATEVDPDVLLIDEILSVGDERFSRKCEERMSRFKERGVSIIFVSHAMEAVQELCDRVVWIDHGKIKMEGVPQTVIDEYQSIAEKGMDKTEGLTLEEKQRASELYGGSLDVEGKIIERLNASPKKVKAVALYGSFARGTVRADSDLELLVISDEIDAGRHRRGKEIAALKQMLSLDVPVDMLLLTAKECLSNFRNHNPIFLDIAWDGIVLADSKSFLSSLIEETRRYIDQRKLMKLADGWAYSLQKQSTVSLSKIGNKDFASAMLAAGKRDIAVGMNILEAGYFDKAVQHFQQSAEKAVKAVLICFWTFKKTHFVGEILRMELQRRELQADWKAKLLQVAGTSSQLEPEVTWSRHPGIDEDISWVLADEYTENDALEMKEGASKAVEIVEEFLLWWFRL